SSRSAERSLTMKLGLGSTKWASWSPEAIDITSAWSPPTSCAIDPRFGSVATTRTLSAAAAVGGKATPATAAIRRTVRKVPKNSFMMVVSSILVGRVGPDDRDPLDEQL